MQAPPPHEPPSPGRPYLPVPEAVVADLVLCGFLEEPSARSFLCTSRGHAAMRGERVLLRRFAATAIQRWARHVLPLRRARWVPLVVPQDADYDLIFAPVLFDRYPLCRCSFFRQCGVGRAHVEEASFWRSLRPIMEKRFSMRSGRSWKLPPLPSPPSPPYRTQPAPPEPQGRPESA